MDSNSILQVLAQAIRGRQQVLGRELSSLKKQRNELRSRERKISEQIAEKEIDQEAFTEATVQSFEADWSRRINHAPIPCPFCFAQGKKSPLRALDGDGKTEPLRCETCRETFYVPTVD